VPKITKLFLSLLLVIIVAIAFGTGYIMGGRSNPGTEDGLNIIEQAWNVIFSDYVDKDRLDTDTLKQAAIEGILEELDDPYTSYLDKDDYQLGMSSLEGEFNGIGAHIMLQDEQLTIVSPIEDSPAAIAGIRTGDVILEIDGVTTADMGLMEAVLKIRGPKGTPVTLLIQHEGDEKPEEIIIVRDKIEVSTVSYEMKDDIAVINISQFSERTDQELATTLESINEQGARGIILDLRNNPGGLLDIVVNVASYFLPDGTVVDVVSNEEKLFSLQVHHDRPVTDLPMVVLVNNFSASGSEVLAGALQDYSRATVAGNTTFGKGSVNVLRQLSDGSGLYITTARWLTPNGRLIEGKGIEPDYILEPDETDPIDWAIDFLINRE